jgi:hypothetical protein
MKESAGQFGELPGQSSAMSHTPPLPRHNVPLWNESPGHTPPLHVSAMSHAPFTPRHVVPLAKKAFVGQLGEVPSQDSAGSQKPVPARHWPPVVNVSAGHTVFDPLQNSAWSHTPLWPRHCVLEDATGYWQRPPLHCTGEVHGLESSPQTTLIWNVNDCGESDESKHVRS